MTVLLLISVGALTGALLAQRFKVLILLPAVVCLSAILIGSGVAHGENVSSLVLFVAVAICGLQVGYIAGAAGRLGMLASYARYRGIYLKPRPAIAGQAPDHSFSEHHDRLVA